MILVAIDGRSAAGKSTLAGELAKDTGAVVIHMDDYFRPRSLQEPGPGGNMDLARFRQEVLEPLKAGKPAVTRPFDCRLQQLQAPVTIRPSDLVIVEGAYCLHPDLGDPWDLRVFVNVDSQEQKRRILERNGPEKAAQFETVWIPREEEYLQTFQIQDRCDLVLRPDKQ